jgi:hypothetical protein
MAVVLNCSYGVRAERLDGVQNENRESGVRVPGAEHAAGRQFTFPYFRGCASSATSWRFDRPSIGPFRLHDEITAQGDEPLPRNRISNAADGGRPASIIFRLLTGGTHLYKTLPGGQIPEIRLPHISLAGRQAKKGSGRT